MDIKEIKQVIDLMKRYGLTEFELEEEAFKIRLRREPDGSIGPARNGPNFVVETPAGLGVGVQAAPVPVAMPVAMPAAATPPPFPSPHHVPAPVTEEPGTQIIKSPMVGTFYRAPSPDAKPFVEEGTAVTPESVVCLIEAMKLMNEIHAEIKGTIVQILVENGKPIEFGQPLFKVKLG